MDNGMLPGNSIIQTLPHSLLQPFVNYYVYRSLHKPPGDCVEKTMPFRPANSIDFFIGDPFETLDYHTKELSRFTRCTIRGPRTCKKYIIRIQRHFISFTIHFHPTGLYRLLGISMEEFTNKAIPAEDIDLLPFKAMTSEMLYAGDINACIRIVESHLLRQAGKCRYFPGITEQISRKIIQERGQTPIRELAGGSYLSLRQLERNFKREVGVSPKTYSSMLRLHHLIRSKISDPASKWGALACEYNYFDQMHFIREFHNFLDINPSEFIPADFAF